jgi:hypothetical protein
MLALCVGGMGARGKYFYNELFASCGYDRETAEIQDLCLDGKTAEAAAAVPQSFIHATMFVGPEEFVRNRLAEPKVPGVAALNVALIGRSTAASAPPSRCDQACGGGSG